MQLIIGIIYSFFAATLTYLQLQGNIKYNWYEKYPIIVLSLSVPISWLYIKSVENIVKYFDGQIWPSRLIGFSVGIVVFTVFSYIFFKEPITLKVFISLILAFSILFIQLFMK